MASRKLLGLSSGFTYDINARPRVTIKVKGKNFDLANFAKTTPSFFKRYFSSCREPMGDIRDRIYMQFAKNFDRSSGRRSWESITQETEKWRERHHLDDGNPPLIASGGLQAAVTMRGKYNFKFKSRFISSKPRKTLSGAPYSVRVKTSIGADKGRKTGDDIVSTNRIDNYPGRGAKLVMSVSGSTRNATKALWALHEGGDLYNGGHCPARDFMYYPKTMHKLFQKDIKDWIKERFSMYKADLKGRREAANKMSESVGGED